MTQSSFEFMLEPQHDAHVQTRETAIRLRIAKRHRKEVKK